MGEGLFVSETPDPSTAPNQEGLMNSYHKRASASAPDNDAQEAFVEEHGETDDASETIRLRTPTPISTPKKSNHDSSIIRSATPKPPRIERKRDTRRVQSATPKSTWESEMNDTIRVQRAASKPALSDEVEDSIQLQSAIPESASVEKVHDSIQVRPTTPKPASIDQGKRTAPSSRANTETPASRDQSRANSQTSNKVAVVQIPKMLPPPSEPPKTKTANRGVTKQKAPKRKFSTPPTDDEQAESEADETTTPKASNHTQIPKLFRDPIRLQSPKDGPGEDVDSPKVGKNYDNLQGPFNSWKLYNNFKEILKANEDSWPPRNVQLQDWHVGQLIVTVPAKKRGQHWPADFDSVGWPRTPRKNKGRAAKELGDDGTLYYSVVGKHYVLIGDEGVGQVSALVGSSYQRPSNELTSGSRCIIQEDFVPDAKELESGVYPRRFQKAPAPEQPAKKQKKSQESNPKQATDTSQQLVTPASSSATKPTQKVSKKLAKAMATPKLGAVSPADDPMQSIEHEALASSQASSSVDDTLSQPQVTGVDPKPVPNRIKRSAVGVNANIPTKASDAPRTPGPHTSMRKPMKQIKLASRAPVKPDMTPFYTRELALLAHQSQETASWVSAGFEAVKNAILDAAQEPDQSKSEELFSYAHDYAEQMQKSLASHGQNILAALAERAKTEKVDVTAVATEISRLQTVYPKHPYPGGVYQSLAPPPLRAPLTGTDAMDPSKELKKEPFPSPIRPVPKTEQMDDSPRTVLGDPQTIAQTVAQQALFHDDDPDDGPYDGPSSGGSGGNIQCLQQ